MRWCNVVFYSSLGDEIYLFDQGGKEDTLSRFETGFWMRRCSQEM